MVTLKRLTCSILAGFLVFCSSHALAEEEGMPEMEALPHHLQKRLEQLSILGAIKALPVSNVEQEAYRYVYYENQVWDPGSTLKICFIGGDQIINSRVAKFASEWSNYGNVKLDFGNMSAPRQCDQFDQSEIRVGYAYAGYWSLVGKQSKDPSILAPGDQSLNLSKFDIFPPADLNEFKRIVQHEFGHALGLHHEHQNPNGKCDEEFVWEGERGLYARLAKAPNYWSKKVVDHNLRALPNTSAFLKQSSHDRGSIMHYSFPANFFKNGEKSSCYVPKNYNISALDKTGMGETYPWDAKKMLTVIKSRGERNSDLLAKLPETTSSASLSVIKSSFGAAISTYVNNATLLEAR